MLIRKSQVASKYSRFLNSVAISFKDFILKLEFEISKNRTTENILKLVDIRLFIDVSNKFLFKLIISAVFNDALHNDSTILEYSPYSLSNSFFVYLG